MLELRHQDKEMIKAVYNDCDNEEERNDAVKTLANFFEQPEMIIRQVLQAEKVYVSKEGKTEKEQYAAALWAITNVKKSEWMKLTLVAQKQLMDFFKEKK